MKMIKNVKYNELTFDEKTTTLSYDLRYVYFCLLFTIILIEKIVKIKFKDV